MRENYNELPRNLRPISPWKYFGLSILYSLPIIGLIFLIIHAISRANINRRNYARSFFCVIVLSFIIIGIILLIQFVTTGSAALLEVIKQALGI